MLHRMTRLRRATDWADIVRAYAYLVRAGWRLFVRRQRLDRWLIGQEVLEVRLPLTQQEEETMTRAARWTNAAARRPFPWARCLQRSLALCLWLEHVGLQPKLRIGVRNDGPGLEAHAWVEYKGHVLNDEVSVGESFSMLKMAEPAPEHRGGGQAASQP